MHIAKPDHFTTSTAFIALIIVIVVWAMATLEKAEPKLWRDRLALPDFIQEENRHTPIQTQGEYLPPTIFSSRTIAPTENPFLLAGRVYVPAGVTLTLMPGTHILVHEYGYIEVDGTLNIEGTASQPVTLTTNEANPSNQVWSGIIFGPSSQGEIDNAVIRHASPGITCEAASSVMITNSAIEYGNTGIVTASQNCRAAQANIRSVDTGIVSFVDPAIKDVSIHARKQYIHQTSTLFALD